MLNWTCATTACSGFFTLSQFEYSHSYTCYFELVLHTVNYGKRLDTSRPRWSAFWLRSRRDHRHCENCDTDFIFLNYLRYYSALSQFVFSYPSQAGRVESCVFLQWQPCVAALAAQIKSLNKKRVKAKKKKKAKCNKMKWLKVRLMCLIR